MLSLLRCIRPFYNRKTGQFYSCGTCPQCRKAKKQEWVMRCSHEAISYDWKVAYITLTYHPKHMTYLKGVKFNKYDVGGNLVRKHLDDYIKRVRKAFEGRQLKVFACGEYGSKKWRPHYHCAIYGVDTSELPILADKWHYGLAYYDDCPVTSKVFGYIVGYVAKKMIDTKMTKYLDVGRQPPFLYRSKGLGATWCDKHMDNWIETMQIGWQGRQCSVPRYYVIRALKSEGKIQKRYNKSNNSFYYKVVRNVSGRRTQKIINWMYRHSEDLMANKTLQKYLDVGVMNAWKQKYDVFMDNLLRSYINDYNDFVDYIEYSPPPRLPGKRFSLPDEVKILTESAQQVYKEIQQSPDRRDTFDLIYDGMYCV